MKDGTVHAWVFMSFRGVHSLFERPKGRSNSNACMYFFLVVLERTHLLAQVCDHMHKLRHLLICTRCRKLETSVANGFPSFYKSINRYGIRCKLRVIGFEH